MFEMHDLNIVCPRCNNPNYMKLMSGANVGKLNVKCTNCNSYFDLNDLEETMPSAQLEPCNITHVDSEHPLSDAEIILRLESIRDSIGGSYAIDRAIELLTKHATCEDVIGRQVAIDAIQGIGRLATLPDNDAVIRMSAVEYVLFNLPSAQPEIIRCNVCRHWHQTAGKMKGFGLGDCDYLEKKLVTCSGYCYWAERRTNDYK